MKLLEDGIDVVKGGGYGNNMSCGVLEQLELVEGFVGVTKEDWDTVVIAGGDETVNQEGSGVRGERWAEMINVS